jgi:hypothetical protein
MQWQGILYDVASGWRSSTHETCGGRFLGQNSLNRHLFPKQRRDLSTPRLRRLCKRQSQGAPLKMTAAGGMAFLSEWWWLKARKL